MYSKPSYSAHLAYNGGAFTHSDAQPASIDVPLDRAWLWSGASVLLLSVLVALVTWVG